MPTNAIKTPTDEKHWNQGKAAYAKLKGKKKKKIKDKYAYIMGVKKKIDENAQK
jgi:hypothetical protein